MKTLLVLACLVAQVAADTYMMNPRGSNNRLNEKSATRANGNRVFDSQNNARGGFNVGDKDDRAAGNNAGKQFQMEFFMSAGGTGGGRTQMPIEWTNQHGCGGNEDTDPNKLNCNIVLQYKCHPDSENGLPILHANDAKYKIHDGTKTNTPDYKEGPDNESSNTFAARKKKEVKDDRVLQDSFEWYDKCKKRDRNKGLFTADQNMNNRNKAINTRQNNNGNRNGYECPEERDYYPYWHPTEWKDMAILAENKTMCPYYKKHSFNTAPKSECLEKFPNSETYRHWSKHNNQAACAAAGGEWTEYHNYLEEDHDKTTEAACNATPNRKWGIRIYRGKTKKCLVTLPEVDCLESPWSRVNHLGNGKDGEALKYMWTLPHFPSNTKQRCVVRLRYNISTDDYDPWKTDSKSNQNNNNGVQSPVTNNPKVDIGGASEPLQLAINTAQFGRTFQDRSHLFYIKPRPTGTDTNHIKVLTVRGKRGNIVQTFPAVEYDFIPTNLKLGKDDLVHITWTGSNTHNNGPNGGDGQTGDAGEGTGGTDRHNMLQIPDRSKNYPTPFEEMTMWDANVKWMHPACNKALTAMTKVDIALQVGSAGFFSSKDGCGSTSLDQQGEINNLLNDQPASYNGILLQMKKGKYYYMCSRNNNFTNRSQKGSIEVTDNATEDKPSETITTA